MGIFARQLVIIMLIRMRAERAGRIRARVREIVHTGVLRRTVFASMTETECMTDFLTHYVQLLVRIIICGRVKICVVHLGCALRDVVAAGDVYRSQTEPAVLTVCAIADLNRSGNHRATLIGSSGNRC